MGEKILLVEKREDKIAIITLNRPEQLNALNSALFTAFKEALEDLAWDDSINVIIVTGSGDKAFCAGVDLKERGSLSKENALKDRKKNIFGFFKSLIDYQKPIIGLINGFAVGGGAELALICDIRIASPNARFGQTEIKWGMLPSGGGMQRLRHIAGMGITKELILTGKIVEADEAYRMHIYNKVVEQDKLMKEGLKLAAEIANNSPVSVQQSKMALDVGADMYSAFALDFEASKEGFYAGDALKGPSTFKKAK